MYIKGYKLMSIMFEYFVKASAFNLNLLHFSETKCVHWMWKHLNGLKIKSIKWHKILDVKTKQLNAYHQGTTKEYIFNIS